MVKQPDLPSLPPFLVLFLRSCASVDLPSAEGTSTRFSSVSACFSFFRTACQAAETGRGREGTRRRYQSRKTKLPPSTDRLLQASILYHLIFNQLLVLILRAPQGAVVRHLSSHFSSEAPSADLHLSPFSFLFFASSHICRSFHPQSTTPTKQTPTTYTSSLHHGFQQTKVNHFSSSSFPFFFLLPFLWGSPLSALPPTFIISPSKKRGPLPRHFCACETQLLCFIRTVG